MDSEGGGGSVTGGPYPPPRKSQSYIEFLNNTGPGSRGGGEGGPDSVAPTLKITKLPSQHSIFGHYRPTNKTPFIWAPLTKLSESGHVIRVCS